MVNPRDIAGERKKKKKKKSVTRRTEEWSNEVAALHSPRQGAVVNHIKVGTVLRATLGKLQRGGAECVWILPSAAVLSSAEMEDCRGSL